MFRVLLAQHTYLYLYLYLSLFVSKSVSQVDLIHVESNVGWGSPICQVLLLARPRRCSLTIYH